VGQLLYGTDDVKVRVMVVVTFLTWVLGSSPSLSNPMLVVWYLDVVVLVLVAKVSISLFVYKICKYLHCGRGES
jgi:hypothetical protein